MFSYGIETVLFGRVFAVVGRSAPREFFECARKVALRRKAQICADRRKGLVGVDKQALRLFDSLFRDVIGQVFARLRLEARGQPRAAEKESSGDVVGGDGFGYVLLER